MTQKGRFTTPDGAQLPYLITGSGPRPLVYIPGAGDGLASADQLGSRMKWWLAGRLEYFRVLYVGRRLGLDEHVSLEQQALDIKALLEHLDWPVSLIEGQSAGGALAQQLALVAPEYVGALALSSTMAWLDETSRALLAYWVELLRDEDWETFFSSTTNLFWTEQRAAMLEPFKRLLVRLARPGDKNRLLVILQQLLAFDHGDLLEQITAPTLVTGGLEDEIFSPALQLAMAERITNVQTIMQPGFGHGNDLENPAHIRLLAAFGRLHIARQELLLGDPIARHSTASINAVGDVLLS